jgi:hypothetical protein
VNYYPEKNYNPVLRDEDFYTTKLTKQSLVSFVHRGEVWLRLRPRYQYAKQLWQDDLKA